MWQGLHIGDFVLDKTFANNLRQSLQYGRHITSDKTMQIILDKVSNMAATLPQIKQWK